MLDLKVYDDEEVVVLSFEHSLLSVSKWEQKHKIPFARSSNSASDMIDYFQDMLVTPENAQDLVLNLDQHQLKQLMDYINDIPTATTFPPERTKGSAGEFTNERIYAQMVGLKIPFHPVETWHFNRLMVFIRAVGQLHEPPKKRKPSEVMTDWIRENQRRREEHKTTG